MDLFVGTNAIFWIYWVNFTFWCLEPWNPLV